ncbi:AAA family ATPase [Anaerovibrio lipolyticus]|uniref:AAA family ATPase n=1 Tax=Anaerovibrio lipolyticus TaxID=82374 RepID=UPI0013564B5E|nr:AAA family ATPase [Anaerovibrio lipolyticus]
MEKKRHKEGLKKCLLIKGARQVGKTFIIKEFGKNEYESFINIDFYRQKPLKHIFEGELSSEEVYKRMTANIPDIKLIPGQTLIFWMRYNAAEMRELHLNFWLKI